MTKGIRRWFLALASWSAGAACAQASGKIDWQARGEMVMRTRWGKMMVSASQAMHGLLVADHLPKIRRGKHGTCDSQPLQFEHFSAVEKMKMEYPQRVAFFLTNADEPGKAYLCVLIRRHEFAPWRVDALKPFPKPKGGRWPVIYLSGTWGLNVGPGPTSPRHSFHRGECAYGDHPAGGWVSVRNRIGAVIVRPPRTQATGGILASGDFLKRNQPTIS